MKQQILLTLSTRYQIQDMSISNITYKWRINIRRQILEIKYLYQICKLPNRFKGRNQADKCKAQNLIPIIKLTYQSTTTDTPLIIQYICITYTYVFKTYITTRYNYNPTCITYY